MCDFTGLHEATPLNFEPVKATADAMLQGWYTTFELLLWDKNTPWVVLQLVAYK